MKKTFLLLATLGFVAVSCSDDDSSDTTPSVTTSAYLPMDSGNYWVYDVESSVMNGHDSLYVANDTVIGGTTYHRLETGALPTGFFPGAMRNNGVRASDGKLLLSGTATVNFTEELPFSIAVDDFVFFNENADTDDILDTETGTIEQEIEGYDVEMDYTLTAKAKEGIAMYTVDGQTYNNVKPVELRLNVEVVVNYTFGGVPLPVTIIDSQDVVISTQYYAEGVGMVHAVTNFQYDMADNIPDNVEVPLPQSGEESQEEILVNFNVE